MASCLQVENLTKSYGEQVLFENISFTIEEGRRVALVAKNGTGKTTLLNIIAGKESHDAGSVVPRRGLRIAYLEQSPAYPAGMTVLEACFHSESPALKAIAEYERAIGDASGEGLQEAMARMDALEAWDYEQRAKRILSRLRIRDFGQKVETLSGGQLKRVALANVLISESDLLILDEPTNHLDTDMTEWLEEYLAASSAALLMVTHDRYFLDSVCSDILEMENRRIYHYAGNYSYYLEKKQERETADAAQRASDMNLYRRELEWMRRQPQARATKARSRIDAFRDLESRLKTTRRSGEVRLDVGASRIGTKIFEARDVSKRFGDVVILDKFNYNFTRYEKLGIVGDNGCGKSTFLKLLTGIERPDSGVIDIGETVRFGYYSQQGLEFDDSMRVIDVVTAIAEQVELGDGRRMSASQLLQHFLFTPERRRAAEVIPLHGADAEPQFPGAGRADQRPGHRNAGHPGRVPASVQRLRDRGVARPLFRGQGRRPPAGFLRRGRDQGFCGNLLGIRGLEARIRSGTPRRSRTGPPQTAGGENTGGGGCAAQALVQRKEGAGSARNGNPGARGRESGTRGVALVGDAPGGGAHGAVTAHSGADRVDRRKDDALAGAERAVRAGILSGGTACGKAGGRPRSEKTRACRSAGMNPYKSDYLFIFSSVRFSSTVCCATRWMYSACSAGKSSVQAVW